jgi:hypothetical protein
MAKYPEHSYSGEFISWMYEFFSKACQFILAKYPERSYSHFLGRCSSLAIATQRS